MMLMINTDIRIYFSAFSHSATFAVPVSVAPITSTRTLLLLRIDVQVHGCQVWFDEISFSL